MQHEFMRISSLDDIESAKYRHNGLWCIGSIFRATSEIRNVYNVNFLLANNPTNYEFHEDVQCLVQLNDKLLKLELTDITPANVIEVYDFADTLRRKMITSITSNSAKELTGVGGFASSKRATIDLFPAVEALVNNYIELLHQVRSNIIASINLPLSEEMRYWRLREICKQITCMENHEIDSKIVPLTLSLLECIKSIDPLIKPSLASRNAGSSITDRGL